MSAAELETAMRPASTNPAEERCADDLGRFGWGMKSASFSQCRVLVVLSARDNDLHGAIWDLDHISDWTMGVLDGEDAARLIRAPFDDGHGTGIIGLLAVETEPAHQLFAGRRFLLGVRHAGHSFVNAWANLAPPWQVNRALFLQMGEIFIEAVENFAPGKGKVCNVPLAGRIGHDRVLLHWGRFRGRRKNGLDALFAGARTRLKGEQERCNYIK